MRHGIAITLMAAALALGTSTTAQAQGGAPEGRQRGGMMGNPQQMEQMLFRGIELDADQKTRVEKVRAHFTPQLQKLRDEMQAARAAGQRNPETMQKMMAVNLEQRDSLRAVLTDAQKTVFDANVAQMQTRRPGGNRPPRARVRENRRDEAPRQRVI